MLARELCGRQVGVHEVRGLVVDAVELERELEAVLEPGLDHRQGIGATLAIRTGAGALRGDELVEQGVVVLELLVQRLECAASAMCTAATRSTRTPSLSA
jgi:hypothetical protein